MTAGETEAIQRALLVKPTYYTRVDEPPLRADAPNNRVLFEGWWTDLEGFALRCERAVEETGARDGVALRRWAQTAWLLGAGESIE